MEEVHPLPSVEVLAGQVVLQEAQVPLGVAPEVPLEELPEELEVLVVVDYCYCLLVM